MAQDLRRELLVLLDEAYSIIAVLKDDPNCKKWLHRADTVFLHNHWVRSGMTGYKTLPER
jgi:hypothetical protein